MESGKWPTFSSLLESRPDSHGGGGDGITGGGAAGSGSGEFRGDRLNLSMASGNRFIRLSKSPPHSHGGGGDGIYGEVRGDPLNRSGQFPRFVPYPQLRPHRFGSKKEKSADCHAGCVSKEEHERLLGCLAAIEDFVAGARVSWMHFLPCTSVRIVSPADRSKAEQHKKYGSPSSSHRGHKSGGGREPADRFQEGFYSRSGMGQGGGGPFAHVLHDLGSSSQPFRGEAAARDSPKLQPREPREGDWCCSCGYPNFARRLRCRDCGRPRPYASASSYAGPSADCRAPPVPPSRAPRAPDIRKRSRSPTWGALPPEEYGGDLKRKRGRDDGHGRV